MQAILIIILYIITAGFAYSVYKDIKRPPETARPEPEPVQNKNIITEPAVIPEQIKPQPVIIPAPKPDPAPVKTEAKKEPEPPKMDRKKLEQTARNCLTAAGCTFDTWSYTRYKSDIELMDIIKEYNLNK